MRIVPPMTRRWYELLPTPYQTEKPIVAVLVPKNWDLIEGDTPDDKYKVMAMRSPDRKKARGLQVIDVKLPLHIDQREKLAEYKMRIADPAYIGALSLLPNRLLLDEDVGCLIFCRDEMWRKPINLKTVLKNKTTEFGC